MYLHIYKYHWWHILFSCIIELQQIVNCHKVSLKLKIEYVIFHNGNRKKDEMITYTREIIHLYE